MLFSCKSRRVFSEFNILKLWLTLGLRLGLVYLYLFYIYSLRLLRYCFLWFYKFQNFFQCVNKNPLSQKELCVCSRILMINYHLYLKLMLCSRRVSRVARCFLQKFLIFFSPLSRCNFFNQLIYQIFRYFYQTFFVKF